MSEPITADWTADSMTLHLGEVGADWVGLHNAALPEHIAAAHNEAMAALRRENEQLRRKLGVAEAGESYWKEQHVEAWKLIGRIDYALEFEIAGAKELRGAKKWAVKMCGEIKAKVERHDQQ
jgi:hypothetical protein